jgi:hypothetical protein
LIEHDLFGKPLLTFPDHALEITPFVLFVDNKNAAFRKEGGVLLCAG